MFKAKYLIICIFIFFAFLSSNAQVQKLFNIDFSTEQYNVAGIDNLGSVYLYSTASLVKLDKTGSILYSYAEHKKGQISYVDISNPFKILVLHRDAQELVVLNNKLSPIVNSYSLFDLGFSDVSLVCASQDNGFWIYDEAKGSVNLVTFQGVKLHFSNDLRQILESTFQPVKIAVYDSNIYLFDKFIGLIELSNVANFKRLTHLDAENISINASGIFFVKSNKMYQFLPAVLSKNIIANDIAEITCFDYYAPYFLKVLQNNYSLYLYSN